LLEQIEQRADLRNIFIRDEQGGLAGGEGDSNKKTSKRLCRQAMAI
jgi:hypothetical protein